MVGPTGLTEPRYIPPAPPKKAEEKDSFKDNVGDILDNLSVPAKLLNLTVKSGLADRYIGKASVGLDLATDLPKGVAGHVKNIAGAEPKAPVGMRGSITERKEGLKATRGRDGKLRLTHGSKVSLKAEKALKRVPGVERTQQAIGDFNKRIDNSRYATKNRAKAGEVAKKHFDKAVALGKRAATETGVKKAGAKLGGQAAKSAGKLALKSGGRFAPGANVAIAAADWYSAGKTLKDSKASDWKKGTKLATAAFSTVAATNIPVVSQVGAGLSLAADLASNISPAKAVEGVKNLAESAGDVAKKGFNKAKDFLGVL
jgi:hypothetical protein